MKTYRIGVLTSGGDCAGINSAIKWVVKTALDDRSNQKKGTHYEVLGIRDGWKGLIRADSMSPNPQEYTVLLTQETVRTWDRYGGTYFV